MGDWYQCVVDVETTGADAELQGERLRDWLIAEGIVEPVITDCVLGGDGGHPPGPNFASAVSDGNLDLARELRTNGVEIVTGREVYYVTGSPVGPVTCPHCGYVEELQDDGSRWHGAFTDAINAWYLDGRAGGLPCVSCGSRVGLNDWDWGEQPWAFGEAGMRIWNWPPLTPEFVARVGRLLRHRVVYNCAKL